MNDNLLYDTVSFIGQIMFYVYDFILENSLVKWFFFYPILFSSILVVFYFIFDAAHLLDDARLNKETFYKLYYQKHKKKEGREYKPYVYYGNSGAGTNRKRYKVNYVASKDPSFIEGKPNPNVYYKKGNSYYKKGSDFNYTNWLIKNHKSDKKEASTSRNKKSKMLDIEYEDD